VTHDRNELLATVVAEIEGQLDEAGLALQQRDEWRNARAFCDGLQARISGAGDDGEALADLVREGEAIRDLLSIADTEVNQAAESAEQAKQERLREDERLLSLLDSVCKRYTALIVASFVLPVFFVTLFLPIRQFVLLALIPSLLGFLRTKAVCDSLEGRVWLILQARVDEFMSRVRTLHGAAAGSAVAGLLWFVAALISVKEQSGG